MAIPGGDLHRCEACAISFRWPRSSKEELDALYRNACAVNWKYDFNCREDWIRMSATDLALTTETIKRFSNDRDRGIKGRGGTWP